MKKILLFLLSLCLFSCGDFGVSSEEEETTEINSETGEELPTSSIQNVAYAFYSEYKKYVINEDGLPYTDEFSLQAIDSIYAIVENVSGYGSMPTNVGTGDIENTEIAQAFGKLVATYKDNNGTLISYDVLLYDNLDVNENTFISTVMGVFMGGDGAGLLSDLINMNNDYEAIITLADLIETSAISGASSSDLNLTDDESSNMRANIVYTATVLIQYITSDNLGIVSRYNNTLPNDEDLLSSLSSAFSSVIYATGSTIDLTVDTPDFDVSLIYTDDFISTLAPIFQNYYNN